MDQLISGIPYTVAYLDDIVVTGRSKAEHDVNLRQVLGRLQEAGLRLHLAKCEFGVSEVVYLGHRIDANGLHPVQEKVEAIQQAPAPTNLSELRSFLGMINYYARFIQNLSSILEPLNSLMRKNTDWVWKSSQQTAFNKIKLRLLTSPALTHYDPKLPMTLACDASPYGVGAVLSHVYPDGTQRPIGFASRTLNPAERNYSQLDKEALAIVFGFHRFHKYLFGHQFVVHTDHKPLVGLFRGNIPPMASPRWTRWALFIANYEFDLQYLPGKQNCTADALSRLPLPDAPDSVPEPMEIVLNLNQITATSQITTALLKTWTTADPILSQVVRYVKTKWPKPQTLEAGLRPFYRRREELSLQDGLLLWGSRVVIPPPGRKEVLRELHEGHPGMSRMKSSARSYVWWPECENSIDDTVCTCQPCQEQHIAPPTTTMPWPVTTQPWDRIHIDFCGPVLGANYLIIVDSYSKWMEAIRMGTITTAATVGQLQKVFSVHGFPHTLVSDNGPQFTSEEFRVYLESNGVKHITTAAYHPASNGLAERAVQTFKSGMKKVQDSPGSVERFLMSYRTTPHTTIGKRPDQMLFGRKIRTKLDRFKPTPSTSIPTDIPVTRYQPCTGDEVYVKNYSRHGTPWVKGVVREKLGNVMCLVELEDGKTLRKHLDQIRRRHLGGDLPNEDLDLEWPVVGQPAAPANPAVIPVEPPAPVPIRHSGRAVQPPKRLEIYDLT